MESVGESAPQLSTAVERRPGGWKTMPFVLGTETVTRLATFGLQANFLVYLMRVYHMELVQATYVINVWSGISNFTPLAGAVISDAKFGCYKTIAVASFASLTGILMMTLSAWLPTLHPPSCPTTDQMNGKCQGASASQVAFMVIALGLLSIGAGGIKPCNVPFGVDQFDRTTEEGQKSIRSFYNWYYTSFTVAQLITSTLIVYIQEKSWVWGYGILTFLMAFSIALFFAGTRMYVHVKPKGSIFIGIIQVLVVAVRKRNLLLPSPIFYDPPVAALETRLPQTDKYRWLNKAAVVVGGDLGLDGFPTNKWRLVSIQQVEEVKCVVKILPVWMSGMIIFAPMLQEGTVIVYQSMAMDRHLGPQFQFPPGSIRVVILLTMALWLPFYDRVMVPALRKVTHIERGITQLQRVGAGSVLSILAMVVAGVVERYRRDSANEHPPMSALWLAPQLILIGLSEAFNMIGQTDFYNSEFPHQMRSVANSLLFCSIGVAFYFCTFLVKIVVSLTGGQNRPNWLTKDVNKGRLDFYYFLLAGIGAFNLGLFLYAAIRYQYKPVQAHPREEAEEQLG